MSELAMCLNGSYGGRKWKNRVESKIHESQEKL